MEELDKLSMRINDVYAEFCVNSIKEVHGNKAAGVRARKATLELEKLFKEYRKRSLGK